MLDTGELACRHRRSFAGGLTITDPSHQTELERQRTRRRQRHDVDVEVRPLARYDRLIPADEHGLRLSWRTCSAR